MSGKHWGTLCLASVMAVLIGVPGGSATQRSWVDHSLSPDQSPSTNHLLLPVGVRSCANYGFD